MTAMEARASMEPPRYTVAWFKWRFRQLRDWAKDRTYPGPTPPRRLAEEVLLFRIVHPRATINEWDKFAARLAHNAYRDGFTRGQQWRDRGWRKRHKRNPQQEEEQRYYDWSFMDGRPEAHAVLLAGHDPADPLQDLTPEERERFAATFRLVQASPYPVTVQYTDDERQE